MSKDQTSQTSPATPIKQRRKKGSTADYPMVDLREVCDFVQTIREKGVEAETMPIVAKACGYAAPTSTGFYRRIVAARLFQLRQPQGSALTPPAVTAAELKRIQDWLSFQLLITQNELNEPE